MKIRFDKDADALHFLIDESQIVESEEVHPGVILDFDAEGRVVGVEFLEFSRRGSGPDLLNLHYQPA